jgi:hypothetical protein
MGVLHQISNRKDNKRKKDVHFYFLTWPRLLSPRKHVILFSSGHASIQQQQQQTASDKQV